MSKTLLGIVNSFDPEAKLWQNAALTVKWDGSKFVANCHMKDNAQYMKAMDGWVFAMRYFAKEQGVDHPPYAVYDARTLELTPMTQEDFTKLGEL